jgi:hypothetical protein
VDLHKMQGHRQTKKAGSLAVPILKNSRPRPVPANTPCRLKNDYNIDLGWKSDTTPTLSRPGAYVATKTNWVSISFIS